MAKVLLSSKTPWLRKSRLIRILSLSAEKRRTILPSTTRPFQDFMPKSLKIRKGFPFEDLNSLNGTFVNGQRIAKSPLNNADVILIGVHTLEVMAEPRKNVTARKTVSRGIHG